MTIGPAAFASAIRWLRTALSAGRAHRGCRREGRSLILAGLLAAGLVAPVAPVAAAGLECPVIGENGIPNLAVEAPELDRLTTANTVDLANEINGLITRLQAEKPGLSADDMANGLIAAFCPVVAARADLSAGDKWKLVHRFDTVLMQQIAANAMPPGSMIIASVPLPPDVFRDLSTRAESAKQSPTQYMATILMKAVGR